jgi:hypothetical protein
VVREADDQREDHRVHVDDRRAPDPLSGGRHERRYYEDPDEDRGMRNQRVDDGEERGEDKGRDEGSPDVGFVRGQASSLTRARPPRRSAGKMRLCVASAIPTA